MAHGLRFNLSENLYLRDPQESTYGKKLLENAVLLLGEIGFEAFTFKKLAIRMESAETSIYRYFENKHLLLLYLNCWYWEWVHYLININTTNIDDPKRKLKTVIHNLLHASKESQLTAYVNEQILHQVIVREGTKSYHIHSVDQDNLEGHFRSYKELVAKIAEIILEVNPSFKYPNALGSALFEMVNNQLYYAEHIPRLTNIANDDSKWQNLTQMVSDFAFAILGCSDHK